MTALSISVALFGLIAPWALTFWLVFGLARIAMRDATRFIKSRKRSSRAATT